MENAIKQSIYHLIFFCESCIVFLLSYILHD
nr:MAG TPA: hypothetical protein [Caudoviricetes sp.]